MKGRRYTLPSNDRLLQMSRRRFREKKDEEVRARRAGQMKIAEEERLEQERLAREARTAEEARLVEQSRREEELIAEVAREGNEAKKRRLEELEETVNTEDDEDLSLSSQEITIAKIPDTDDKELVSEPIQEQEVAASSSILDDNNDGDTTREDPLEEVIWKAVEQERQLRAMLEAARETSIQSKSDNPSFSDQKVAPSSSSPLPDETFQRRLLAATLHYGSLNGKESEVEFPVLGDKAVINGSTGGEMQKVQDRFQRQLLAARLRMAQLSDDVQHKTENVDSVAPTIAGTINRDRETNVIMEDLDRENEPFHRNLLAARIRYEKSNGVEYHADVTDVTVRDDMFHRNLLAARIQFEKKNDLKHHVESTNGTAQKDLFHRDLMAARFRYEKMNAIKHHLDMTHGKKRNRVNVGNASTQPRDGSQVPKDVAVIPDPALL